MILSFEMKYNNMVRNRLDALECAMEDMSMEQARLNSHASVMATATNYKATPRANSSVNPTIVLGEDSKYEENTLFPPNSMRNSMEYPDKVLG